MSLPTISVLVLNYNGREHLNDCFSSLMAQDYPADCRELVFVDNGSTDGSVQFMREYYPAVRIIENGENLGFAAGYNRAAQMVGSDYLAFLNNDTCANEHWLTELVQPCLKCPTVTCVGSLILNWNGERIDFADAALNFMGWGCQPAYGKPYRKLLLRSKDLLFACGGAMLVKRDAFLGAHGFDPAYFCFFEDVDLGWGLQQLGNRVVLNPKAIVFHRHHGTAAAVTSPQRWFWRERNALFNVIKHYEDQYLIPILPAALLLLWERAYLDLVPRRAFLPAAEDGQNAYGPGYYLRVVSTLVREGDLNQLALRTKMELLRRLPISRDSVFTPGPRPKVPRADVVSQKVAVASSRLAAGAAVLAAMPDLRSKRQALQSARQRQDRDVFRLFRWPLVSNFDDDRFFQAMHWLIKRLGIKDIFATPADFPQFSEETLEKSRQVSIKILKIMEIALTLSGFDKAAVELEQPVIQENLQMTENTICLVEAMDLMLWSIPPLTPGAAIDWLDDRCTEVLNQVQQTTGAIA